ncbi:hypothetical protein V5P93_001215 [Actinokineospora auranticolor]|uniref:Lipoprotein n=1 Tax=Actinokineospora auranticolor TaxID=155976 RepID=A0A2S6GUP0_9PSEU|nr:hypothetical protein [Actinokineospora auranticolor]PPK68841.1 hypothetical protein CLV40_10485 [Actinokineospora auranticolor]
MRWRSLVICLAALTVGCSAQPPDLLPAPTTMWSAPPSTSTRGNLVKQVGQRAGMEAPDGKVLFFFAIDKITIDPPCADDPAHGHRVALAITLRTTDDFSPEEWEVPITSGDFEVTAPDGSTETEVVEVGPCLRPEQYLTRDRYARGTEYRGLIVLDTKHTNGFIVFRSNLAEGGVEWSF